MREAIPEIPRPITEAEVDAMNVIVLSFVGDGVQTLYERTLAAETYGGKSGELHKMVSRMVNATRQAEAARAFSELLNERETEIYKRARNVKPKTLPKHSTQDVYRAASGFEAVVGYLYLTGQNDRLAVVLDTAYGRK